MKILSILFVLLTTHSFSNTLQVKEIIPPDSIDSNYLLFVSSGEVIELPADKLDILEELKWAKETGSNLNIELVESSRKTLNQRSVVSTVSFINSTNSNDFIKNSLDPIPTPTKNYNFSAFDSIEQVDSVFQTMTRRTRRKSQCYNRAHVWSYDIHQRFNSVNLGKMWIFFTRKYIKEYRYKWWFHIAPFTYVKGNPREQVLDRSYFKGPADFQTWTNFFMKNDAQCRFVEYYSQYNDNQQSEYCYLIKSSMYYYQPYQIENLEKGEEEKTEFKDFELRQARRNAIY